MTSADSDPQVRLLLELQKGNPLGIEQDAALQAADATSADLDWLAASGQIMVHCYPHSVCVSLSGRGRDRLAAMRMRSRLESIVSADPQSEQAEWMIQMAREGLDLE